MFRFTIRDVLWLTVVVALALGWWNEHQRFAAYYKLVTSHIKWKDAGGGAATVRPQPLPAGPLSLP
jgi:hypothetical protein